jgi:hypothetical protein
MFRTLGRVFTYMMFFSCFLLLFIRPILIEGPDLNIPLSLGLGLTPNLFRATYFLTNGSNLVGFEHWLVAKIAELCASGLDVCGLYETERASHLTRFKFERGVLVSRREVSSRGRLSSLFQHGTRAGAPRMDQLSLLLVGPRVQKPWVVALYRRLYKLLRPAILFLIQFFILCSQILEFEENEGVSAQYMFTLLALSVLTILAYHSIYLDK